jgi:hypothetical protein
MPTPLPLTSELIDLINSCKKSATPQQLQRMYQLIAGRPMPKSSSTSTAPTPPPGQPPSNAAAEHTRRKERRRELRTAESRVAKLEGLRDQLDTAMAVNGADHARIAELAKARDGVVTELAEAEEHWLTLAAEAEDDPLT